MKILASLSLALAATFTLHNSATAQELIKERPTPSRAEWAPLGQAHGRDYSTSDVTKIVVLGSGTPVPNTRHGGISVAVIVNAQPYIIDCGPGLTVIVTATCCVSPTESLSGVADTEVSKRETL